MGALAEVAGLLKVTLSSMVCPGAAPTTVATPNPCPDLVGGKLIEGCTLAQVMLSLITEWTITFHFQRLGLGNGTFPRDGSLNRGSQFSFQSLTWREKP